MHGCVRLDKFGPVHAQLPTPPLTKHTTARPSFIQVVDKVLRQVLSDVIVVEDTLREFPERTGAARMKKVSKPLSKLEGDLVKLTSALTAEGNTADAAGLQRPLFSLCSDGYLLCEPE